jgi:GT2 family glycosyltransferase
MELDVVVVAYRSGACLRKCVEPLAGRPGVAVFVVDNQCPDGSPALVADLPLTTVALGRNAGFGAGCNAGVRIGSAPAVLFLNPDAQIDPSAALALASRLEFDPSLGAVGPRIVGEDGSTHLSVRRLPRLRSAFGEALFLHHLLPRAQWATEFVRSPGAEAPAEWLSGAVLCVRRSSFEAVGGFDERFFLYSEDTDICARLRQAGFGIAYEPAVTAMHVGGGSARAAGQEEMKLTARLLYARLHESHSRYAAFRVAYAFHQALRLPVALVRSREHARGRAAALGAVLAVHRQR